MKIFLFRSEEVSVKLVQSVVNRIGKRPGPIEFIWLEAPADEDENLPEKARDQNSDLVQGESIADPVKEILPWEVLFGQCENYRQEHRIREEDVVVLFTAHENERRFFSAWEPAGNLNFFIRTSGWELFIESDPSYPVIYELASIPLAIAAFDNMADAEKWGHLEPRGCVFDYCMKKAEVQLRLRTADICPDCRDLLIRRKTAPALARQIFATFDSIRSQMLFRTRFQLTKTDTVMEVDFLKRKLRFPEMGNIEFTLTPREMAVYIFFLKHPEGILYKNIYDYKREISMLYRQLSISTMEANIENALNAMLNPVGNAMNELISQIKAKIRLNIGVELSGNYTIQGEKGDTFSILLNRDLVKFLN
jgi:hypothetical protein